MTLRDSKFVKDKYRVLAEIDYSTLDFPKEKSPTGKKVNVKENDDFYIPCLVGNNNGTKITFTGTDGNKHKFCLYTTKQLWESHGKEIPKAKILKVDVWQKEVDVYFYGEQLDLVAKVFKARTKGAKIKPYDNDNLKRLTKGLQKET